MAEKGVIRSRWDLDLTTYKRKLKEGLDATQTAVEAMNKLLGGTATLPSAPTPSGPTSRGTGNDAGLKAQREAVRQLTTAYTDLQIARSKGEVTQAEFLRQGQQLEAQLRRERSALEEGSQGYTLYTTALQRVTNGLAQVEGVQTRAVQAQERAAQQSAAANERAAARAEQRAQREAAAADRQATAQEKATQRQAAAQGRADQAYNLDRVRQYRDELTLLNLTYEQSRDRKAYIADVTQLQLRMARFRQELPATSKEVGALDRVLGTATRNLSTVEGRLSGLGISQQIAVGLNQRLASSFAAQTGPIGDATLGLVAMNGGLGAVSTGAALAGGAILGIGVGTAALVQRGVPQVKSFQNSINILASSGAEDLDKLDRTLANLQEQAGRAGRSFSRAELAAALAETVKAGVDADSALKILRSSLNLAAAEGTSLTESTSLVLKAIRQYGLEVDDASVVTDRLAQAGLLAASNTSDISTGLSRVAGTGRAAGVEMSDLIGMIVELDNKGLEASDRGANALNSALSAIAGLTPKARAQLRDWNIEVDNSDGSARLAGDILADLGDRLRSAGVQYDESTDQLVGNGDALRGLANIMGTEGARAVLNLTGQWREYAAEVENSTGASQRFADQQTQGLEPAQKRAKAALDDLGKSLAQIFAPGMEFMANQTARLADELDRIGNAQSVGAVFDVLLDKDAQEQLARVNGDIANYRQQMQDIKDELGNPTEIGPLGLFRFTPEQQGPVIELAEQELDKLEAQVQKLLAERDAILERYNLKGDGEGGQNGSDAGPKVALPMPQITASFNAGIDPARLAEYEQAIKDSQDALTEFSIGAMQEGTAKINAEYYERLEVERRAFEALTDGLDKNSKQYQDLLSIFNTRTSAIRQEGLRLLEDESAQQLETARNLNNSILDAQNKLATEQANSSNDPLKVLSNTFQQTVREIERNSADLMRQAEQAYNDGAIGFQQYQDKIVQIAKLSAAQQLQAQVDLTNGTNAELERRKQFIADSEGRIADLRSQTEAASLRASGDEQGAQNVERAVELRDVQTWLAEQLQAEGLTQGQIDQLHEEAKERRVAIRKDYSLKTDVLNKQDAESAKKALEDQSKAVQNAEIAGMATIPAMRARFAQEQQERAKANKQALNDFKGTAKEKQQLINKQNQEERLLARQHQQELNKAATDALKAYAVALKQHHDEVARIRGEARQQELESQRALLNIQTEIARQETSSDNIDVQAAAYERLIRFQEREVAIASNLVDVAKARGATTEEVIQLQEKERAAYEASIGAINSQITALENHRDKQLEIVNSGSDVLKYFQTQQELTGTSFYGPSEAQVGNFLKAQLDGYEELYREAVKANAPLEDRIALQEKLKSTLAAAKDEGVKLSLDDATIRLMEGDTLSEVASFPAKAGEAVDSFVKLNTQIGEIKTSLQDTTSLFAEFLDKVVGKDGIPLRIKIDESSLEEAREALRSVFGDDLANRVIAQAENAGTKGGKEMMSKFGNALLNNPEFLKDTSRVLLDLSQNAGGKAGKGLMEAFAEGAIQNKGVLGAAIRDIMQTEVRDYLTGSNAKKGPLSDVIQSGGGLVRGYTGGMRREFNTARSASREFASIMRPAISAVAIPTSRPASYPAAAGPGAPGAPLIGTLNVNGTPSAPTSVFEMSASQFYREAERVAQRELRKAGK